MLAFRNEPRHILLGYRRNQALSPNTPTEPSRSTTSCITSEPDTPKERHGPGRHTYYPMRKQGNTPSLTPNKWIWTPPEGTDSRNARHLRHGSRQARNATTVGKQDTFQGNAHSPGKTPIDAPIAPQRPPTKSKKRKRQGTNPNRRETTTLGNRCRQPLPEGNTCCQTQRRPPVPSTNRLIRTRGENYDQSTNPGGRWERMHHYSLGGQWGIRKLH